MKRFKLNIKRELKVGAVLVVVFGLIAFTERMEGEAVVRNIQIRINNIHENHFLDENDIMQLMQFKAENMIGVSIGKINFKDIENRIKRDPFIEDADLYSDLKGNVIVGVTLRRPVARIMRNDGPDGYVAEDGTVMPVSDKFTPRVILITGAYVGRLLQLRNLKDDEEGQKILTMLAAIRENEFWNAQIAELIIDSKRNVVIYPQVGDERIEFGRAEDVEGKLRKLMIFYKEILPRVGWNKYNRVNLNYEGQIVAE